MQSLLFRYRFSLGAFIVGLILSGVTAFPLLAEMRILASWLGILEPEHHADYPGLARIWTPLHRGVLRSTAFETARK
jgi:hypothetical protein